MGGKTGALNKLFRYFQDLGQAAPPRVMARAEAIAADDPRMLEPLAPRALHRTLAGENPVVSIRPGDFEGELAYEFPEASLGGNDPEAWKRLNEYIEELAQVASRGGGFNEMPQLWLRAGWVPGEGSGMELPGLFVEGHEGRHRTRAMELLGYPHALVEATPTVHPGPRISNVNRLEELIELLDQRVPVYGEDLSLGGSWAGGEDFPFFSRYRQGGQI